MGATHKNYSNILNKNTLGWNSNTKKHGGPKRQVRCILLDRGYQDDLKIMNATIQRFGKHLGIASPSCKTICEEHWKEFKEFI